MVDAAECGRSGRLDFQRRSGGGFALNVGLSSVGCDSTGQNQTGRCGDDRGLTAHAAGVVADCLGNSSQRVGPGDLGAVPGNG